jgi:hypothetical protein
MDVDAAGDDTGEEVDAAAAAGIDNTGVSSTQYCTGLLQCCVGVSWCVGVIGGL